MRKSVPDRWLDYSNIGKPIPGTKFIAFKVPLKQAICDNLPSEKRFTPDMLLESAPNIKIIVNLTFTNSGRYYYYEDFSNKSVKVIQIKCPGHGKLPTPDLFKRFYNIVDDFTSDATDKSSLIGVHCTHGLNRTGLFICKYMVDKMGIKPTDAIKHFETSRGHPMERKEYIDFIRSTSNNSPRNKQSNWRAKRYEPQDSKSYNYRNNYSINSMSDRYNSNPNRYTSNNRASSGDYSRYNADHSRYNGDHIRYNGDRSRYNVDNSRYNEDHSRYNREHSRYLSRGRYKTSNNRVIRNTFLYSSTRHIPKNTEHRDTPNSSNGHPPEQKPRYLIKY